MITSSAPSTQTQRVQGQCLCGSVHLSMDSSKQEIGVCHCAMCRKWVGGPFFAIECEKGALEIKGESHITYFNSSEWAERAFCKRCGSSLFYQLKEGDMIAVSAGLFDIPSFCVKQQIFIDEKPGYYDLSNDTPKLTGAEVFAQFESETR